MTDKLIVNVALTGCVASKADNPALPITPDEIAEDARRCAGEGASIFHLHARDEWGNPTWRASHYKAIIDAVRAKVPDAIICVSCSGRHFQQFDQRSEVLNLTGVDMASLTMGSVDFRDGTAANSWEMVRALARKMERHDIVPECEVFDLGHAYLIREMVERNQLLPPLYVNLFAGVAVPVYELLSLWSPLPKGTVWSAAGVGGAQFLANQIAIDNGGHVRTGLEDNLLMGKGEPATNPALVARIVGYARSVGREPASCEEARKMIWDSRRE